MTTILTIIAIIIIFLILFKVFKLLLRILLVVVFLILAYITNPSALQHEQAVEEKAAKTGRTISGKQIQVTDYKVFSLTYLTEGQSSRVVGAGAFTMVFIFGSV